MPRKRVKVKDRRYDPSKEELWWLIGKPFPPFVPGLIKQRLGAAMRLEDTEFYKQELNPFAVLNLENLSHRRGNRVLERLRELYDAAPDEVKVKVPEIRRRILEEGPTRELVAEDRQRTEKLQRETTWKSDWLNRYVAMSEDELDELVKQSVRQKPEY